jgi:hypothetical protein
MKCFVRLGAGQRERSIQNLAGEDLFSSQIPVGAKCLSYFAQEVAIEAAEFQETLKDVAELQEFGWKIAVALAVVG